MPELCGLPLWPFIFPPDTATLQGGQDAVLGAGAHGTVRLGTLHRLGAAGADVPVVLKTSDKPSTSAREFVGGMSICSALVPCPPETPVVNYEGAQKDINTGLEGSAFVTVILDPVRNANNAAKNVRAVCGARAAWACRLTARARVRAPPPTPRAPPSLPRRARAAWRGDVRARQRPK